MALVHRVHTTASPAQVWVLLGDPHCWPQFEVLLRRVRGRAGPATAGAHLVGVARVLSLGVPVDVVEAVPESRLVLVVHTAPGVRQTIATELTPSVQGGCDVRVSVVVDGLFARLAFGPLWLGVGFTTRVLVARTDRLSRAGTERGAA